MDLLLGLLFSTTIAFIAYKKESLAKSGLYSAILIGTLIYYFGGWILWLTLMMFFISSSLLSKFKKRQKHLVEQQYAKGDKRDYFQVLANGFLPTLFAILAYFTKNSQWIIVGASAIAGSNADTWGSELGVLTKGKTYSIKDFHQVLKGESGGISLFGTLISFLGAFFIGFTFIGFNIAANQILIKDSYYLLITLTLSGFMGSIVDSYLGATVQAKYICQVCHKKTEKNYHHDVPTIHTKGLIWMTNDMVNFLSTLFSTISLSLLLFR